MKTKQLANVLIKILGLSILIGNIPRVILGLVNALQASGAGPRDGFLLYNLSSLIVPVIGICLIVKSRAIAEFLFKNEEE